jgi:hypothetical protein
MYKQAIRNAHTCQEPKQMHNAFQRRAHRGFPRGAWNQRTIPEFRGRFTYPWNSLLLSAAPNGIKSRMTLRLLV